MTTVELNVSPNSGVMTNGTGPASSCADLVAGSLIAERFVLDEVLGEGGQSIVWKAHDTGAENAPVAIKFFKTSFSDRHASRHFMREAKTLIRIKHPSIVALRHYGEWSSIPYIVMEFVEGECLADWLEGRRRDKRPLTLADVADVFDRITGAIATVHEQSIAHRDISPYNVMVRLDAQEKPHVKIIDFGLARFEEGRTLTTLAPGGTHFYVAPEQMAGKAKNAKEARRADVYSLAVLLVEMITLETPEDPISGIANVGHRIPKRLREVIVRALQTDPQKRFADALDFRRALRKVWPDLAKKTPLFHVKSRAAELAAALFFLLLVVGVLAWQDASFRLYMTECLPQVAKRQWYSVSPAPAAPTAPPAFVFDEQPPPPDTVDCEKGGDKDCTTLGIRYEYAQGVERNYATAAMYYQRACRLEDGLGCNRMGLLLNEGYLVKREKEMAAAYFDAACDLGDLRGCAEYAYYAPIDDRAEFNLYERACSGDDGLACKHLAEMYWKGRGVPMDREVARSLAAKSSEALRKRCDVGELTSCDLLANQNFGVPTAMNDSWEIVKLFQPDVEAGATLLRKTCNAGEIRACWSLADRYYDGQGVNKDIDLSYRQHVQSCKAGRLHTCRHTAEIAERAAGTSPSIAIATAACSVGDDASCELLFKPQYKDQQAPIYLDALARTYVEKCNAGDANGCRIAGDYYSMIKNDNVKADKFFQAGCDLGAAHTCSFVARRRAKNTTNESDKRYTATLLESRCHEGHLDDCCDYAGMLMHGEGTTKDPATAMRIWDAICGEGNGCACTNVGSYSKHGHDVPQDFAKARLYWTRACDLDQPAACMSLALLYTEGTGGIPKDPALAQALKEKSCWLGYEYACVAIKPPNPCQ